MYVTLIVLIIIAAILLTLIVLVQNSKGGGLAAGFQSSNQIMGVRKTTDFLEKATWGLAAFIIVLSILAVGIRSKAGEATADESAIKEQSADINKQMQQGTATPNFGEVPKAQPAPANQSAGQKPAEGQAQPEKK